MSFYPKKTYINIIKVIINSFVIAVMSVMYCNARQTE